MLSIEKCEVIPNTLVASFLEKGYADSYRTEVDGHISMKDYVYKFYTSPLFKLERFILTWSVRKPSTDMQAKEISEGNTNKFAAWTLEDRRENELLMRDMADRTRSWFMVNHLGTKENPKTQLYFGTGISPSPKRNTEKSSIGFFFTALLPFHKAYSVLLLYFAKRQLIQT
jgi:hypothetical protein